MKKPRRTHFLGLRVSAILECLVLLLIMLLVDYIWFEGDRFFHVCPQPFWAVVLLIAVQYGTPEGIMAAVFSTIALLLWNMPEQTANQDAYAYALYAAKNPIMWLVAAVILGELQQRHLRARERLEKELQIAEEREYTIAQSYQWVKELKEKLELRIAGQLRSDISTYRAAHKMEALEPTQVLKGLETLVRAVLNAEKFSIWTQTSAGFEISLIHGWADTDDYPKIVPKTSMLYQSVVSEKRPICAVNPDHEVVLAGQGVLAGALIDDETGQITGMLKIERLGFTDLNLSSIETFHAVCEWAGMSMVNAGRYQTAKHESVINPDHNLLTPGYFDRYTKHISSLAKRVGFDVTLISVGITNAENFDQDTRVKLSRVVADSVNNILRAVDLAFDYREGGGDYSIVLPATSRAGADIVIEKIRKDLGKRIVTAQLDADFTFSIQSLHEK